MKRMYRKLFAALFIVLILAGQGFGQEKKHLTLDESIQIGLKNSKTLHASKMRVLAASAKVSEVGTARLPSLSLSASYTRLSHVPPFSVNTPFGNFDISPAIFDNYNVKLSLQQPIFTGFKLSSSHKMADYASKAQKEEYSKDEQDLLYNIKNAYWGLFKANKFKEAIDENVQQVKAHLEDVKNFYKQGLATKNEVLKVEVQLSEAQLKQIDAKNSVKLAVINLDNIIGLPLSTDIDIQKDVDTQKEVTPDDLDVLVKKAMENRPELKAMNYKVDASKSGVTLAESNWYPQIFLAGNYYYSKPNQRILPTKNEFYGTWDVSVGLSFDLWNWGKTGDQTDQAKAQYEESKDGLASLKDALTLEVTQDYYNLIKAKEKMLVSGQSVNQAEENYRVTDDKFKQGLTLNSELLDAEVALMQAKTNYAQSIVDYELAQAKLAKSTGDK